jgi:hypothetical protein
MIAFVVVVAFVIGAARYKRTNSYVATLITFDLASGTFAAVWRLDDLPHDSLQLVAAPSSTGGGTAEGAVLVTTNSLYVLDQRTPASDKVATTTSESFQGHSTGC